MMLVTADNLFFGYREHGEPARVASGPGNGSPIATQAVGYNRLGPTPERSERPVPEGEK
jgi:hypothetical protein